MEEIETGIASIPAAGERVDSLTTGASPGPQRGGTPAPEGGRSDEKHIAAAVKGEKYLFRDFRVRLYEEVKGLRLKGLSYRRIIEEVLMRYGVKLSKSHISHWLRGIHNRTTVEEYLP